MLAAIVISHWQLEFVSAEWVAKEHLDQFFSNFFVPFVPTLDMVFTPKPEKEKVAFFTHFT